MVAAKALAIECEEEGCRVGDGGRMKLLELNKKLLSVKGVACLDLGVELLSLCNDSQKQPHIYLRII